MAKEQAAKHKDVGNKAFQQGDFETALQEFTKAIELDPTDHVFYSNRSGCFASLHRYEEALKDATKCVELKPDWAKGYSRKGLALFQLKRYEEAQEVYNAGLKIDPKNATLQEGLEDTRKHLNKSKSPFGDSMWAKLATNPKTRKYLEDKNFVEQLKMLQSNPQMINMLSADPRFQEVLGVVLGLDPEMFRRAPPGAAGREEPEPPKEVDEEGEEASKDEPNTSKDEPKTSTTETKPQPADSKAESKPKVEEPVTETDRNKKEAEAAKEQGNKFYKNRAFKEALEQYERAISLDPDNIAYLTNKAAVLLETKAYDECVAVCKEAINIGQAKRAPFKLMATAWQRMGNAFSKQEKWGEAVEAYNKAFLEDADDKTRMLLKQAQEKKKKAEEQAYLDKDKSLEHKDKGNALFKEGKWVDAIAEYTEALRRDPTNHAVYSNRAACYTKLMDWQRGLEDCNKCLELDPKFVKAYIRKGRIEHLLKQYHKALDTYDKGLALDPQCTELIEDRQRTMAAIQVENATGHVDPQRQEEALKDPEIQAILRDPMISKVLNDMKTDPQTARRALADKSVAAKLEKLMAAGVLQMR